ncbi:hypothetical protein [Streptomyces mayteni]
MGIESEQLVFDYLSRVGDLAHGTSMSAAERAALVGRLRDEIGRQRSAATGGGESRSSVRRILGRMGTPEDVVASASSGGGGGGGAPPPAPVPAAVPAPEAPAAAVPLPLPRLPAAEPGPAFEAMPKAFWPDGDIGGFHGGIEIPEMLRPGLAGDDEPATLTKPSDAAADEPPVATAPAPAPARPSPGRRLARAALGGRRVGGPVELLGVILLVGGTVAGSVVVLALGWLTCYWSPRLSRREAQWATFGMPAVVASGYAVWLLGRAGGYWGELLAEGEAEALLSDHWPWLLRGAALASAALLLLRARRHVPPPKADT